MKKKNMLTKMFTLSLALVTALASTASAAYSITLEQAKTIALNHAGVSSSQAKFVQAKKTWDDGKQIFEIEFYVGNQEYDYEISTTGRILDYDYDAEQYTPPVNPTPAPVAVTLEQAKTIALNHAGVSASQATFVTAKTDWENGQKVYEVEFYVGTNEYDYEISASTGAILSYDYDAEQYVPPVNPTPAPAAVTLEQAKTIALNHAGVSASQARSMKASTDWEKGQKVYEIEFKRNGWEYEYEVRASDGTILEWDKEYDD